jgi:NADPH:quinone reductase-like Zn-dependent oxidoreductase
MKSIQFDQTGTPAEVLSLEEIPIPEPKKGELRIKVTAANINPSDIMFIRGLYGIQAELPSPAGFEATGIVDKCGDDTDLKVGAPVIFTAVGVWQEYVVVAENRVFPAPEGMDNKVACQAFVNPYTAYAMINESGLIKGQWLMLTAGGSAFGQFAIQMCKKKGIKTICTVRRDDQIEDLLALGATAVINTEKTNIGEAVMNITGSIGVDFVFDAVGGDLGASALECLSQGGTMLVYGLLSLKNIPLNSGLMIFRKLTINGFWFTAWLSTLTREDKIKATGEIMELMNTGELQANIEATYTLENVAKAVIHADSPGRKGKIILVIS